MAPYIHIEMSYITSVFDVDKLGCPSVDVAVRHKSRIHSIMTW